MIAFIGCANQLPPGGGEEDKEPPKIVSSYPSSGTTNFRDNEIRIELSEYVDRRSFQDAFRISPPVSGDIVFGWSGKEVDIMFPKSLWKLYPDKTFLVNLNSNLKDLHGNALTQPLTIAFSTGSKIDKAEISGKVFNNDNKVLTILVYIISGGEQAYSPASKLADYITESSSDGTYTLHNLAPGTYRVIAIDDDDRNLLYTADRESFAVLPHDIVLDDSLEIKDVDFYLNSVAKTRPEININDFFKDSVNLVYSSIENNSQNVLPEQSIYFYFKNYFPLRSAFDSSFQLKDAQNVVRKTVLNWLNDSLLEVFPAGNFQPGSDYAITFVLAKDAKPYFYNINFKTASTNSFGDILGSIKLIPEIETPPVIINLESVDIKPVVNYRFRMQDSVFHFKRILENDYSLFAFIDRNLNDSYDSGNPYPFEPAEKFFIYPKAIKVKGNWSVENVIIDFIK